jgi:hypothetical protein
MYDAKYIVPGLVIFLVLITMPLWYNNIVQARAEGPELQVPEGESQCVYDKERMKGEHMQLLNDWRDQVVRQGERFYVHPDGVTRERSLTNTCLGCHTDKTQFCDKCHDYAGVTPYCWDCHVVPEKRD